MVAPISILVFRNMDSLDQTDLISLCTFWQKWFLLSLAFIPFFICQNKNGKIWLSSILHANVTAHLKSADAARQKNNAIDGCCLDWACNTHIIHFEIYLAPKTMETDKTKLVGGGVETQDEFKWIWEMNILSFSVTSF